MIDGVNDRDSDAAELAAFARPLGAHVNLIPLNPTPGYPVVGSSRQHVRQFRDQLLALGVNATIRITRGAEIDAACGQLAASPRPTSARRPDPVQLLPAPALDRTSAWHVQSGPASYAPRCSGSSSSTAASWPSRSSR